MPTCTFFGHRECYSLDAELLRDAIVDLIRLGVDTFYVGNQGQFDAMVRNSLKSLQIQYPHIRFSVVLAYLPIQESKYADLSNTMYPEIEGHPKFAIERRNRWMVSQADFCLCYVNCSWGGAYKFACIAKRRGLTVINLGNAEL